MSAIPGRDAGAQAVPPALDAGEWAHLRGELPWQREIDSPPPYRGIVETAASALSYAEVPTERRPAAFLAVTNDVLANDSPPKLTHADSRAALDGATLAREHGLLGLAAWLDATAAKLRALLPPATL